MVRGFLILVVLAGLAALAAPAIVHRDPLGSAIWWATNSTPPDARILAPGGVVRGTVSVQLQGPDPAQTDIVEAKVDDSPLAAGWSMDLDTQRLQDGPHQIEVRLRDHSFRKNTATVETQIQTDNTPPDVQLELSPAAPTEGRTLVLKIRTEQQATVSGKVDERPLAIQPGSDFRWALVGFSPDPPSTTVTISLTATDPAGNTTTLDQQYDLVRTNYPIEDVEVPAEMEPKLRLDVRKREDALLAPIYEKANGPPRWQGPFTRPAPGEVSTPFGSARTYNHHDYVVHHPGADFAAAEGDEVHVANDGVIVYTGTLDLRGNVVIVDHGAGVYSTYAHLSEALVNVGDSVKRGDVVARVGSTGLSTGPHLHWEVWVAGANVDPLEWAEREMP